jgi:hypothetical protein
MPPILTVCELAHFTGQVDAYVGELVEMVKPVAART